MADDKQAFVEKVRKNHELFGNTLLSSTEAEPAARVMLDIMSRLAVAVAVVQTGPD
jgi:hypothetical protein